MTALSNRYTPISKIVACAPKYFFNEGETQTPFDTTKLINNPQVSKIKTKKSAKKFVDLLKNKKGAHSHRSLRLTFFRSLGISILSQESFKDIQ